MRACYQTLKDNVVRRNKYRKVPIQFDLTFEDFERFCHETDYIAGKGRTCNSYSIDRKENDKGYTYDNIRVLSLSDNSKKHTKVLHFDFQNKTAFVTGRNGNIEIAIPSDENPF